MTEWRIPLSDLDIGEDEIEAVSRVIRSRWLTMGPKTEEFEAAFARHHGARHAIAVTNGTAALQLAYAALGVGPGDEVILPSLTFVATANAAVLCGARPVFAEILSDEQPLIDPGHVEALITPRTRAIAVVHYAGYACPMPALARIAARHALPIVEDCAHAPGVADGGRFLGTWGAAGCFSFFSNKNMTTGEGGMVLAADDAVAGRMRLLRSHGMTSGTWKRHNERPQDYDVLDAAWNFRIDEMRSAIGLVQLAKVDHLNRRRREVSESYRRHLAGLGGVSVPFGESTTVTASHLACLVVSDITYRKRVVDKLTEAGVQTSHHYPPVHLFNFYRERFGYAEGMLPRTESFAARQLTLPLHARLTETEIEGIARTVRDALQRSTGAA